MHITIISKYLVTFCLIPGIIHDAKRSWILPYWGWINSILNRKWHIIFFYYIPQAPNKIKEGECQTGTEYFSNITNILLKKNIHSTATLQHTGTIILNYLILVLVIIFCNITQKNSNFVIWNWQLSSLNQDLMVKLDSDKWHCNSWRHRGGMISSHFT